MASPHIDQRRAGEQGAILVLALLVSLLLLGIGLTAMWMARSGVRVTGNINRRQEALSAAEVGIERARSILAATADWSTLLGTAAGVGCTGVAHDNKRGNVLCDPSTSGPLYDVSVTQLASTTPVSAADLNAYTYRVWIKNDPVEILLNKPGVQDEYHDVDKQVILVAEGQARDGLSYVAIEVTVMLSN